MNLLFHPVTQERWPDFEQFIESPRRPTLLLVYALAGQRI